MKPNQNSDFSILVVDDDIDQLRIIEHLLILDVVLPDINGFEICKKIKSDSGLSTIHILLFSGIKTELENISEGLETGADGYLIKPLINREFLARVKAEFRIIRAEDMLRKSENKLAESNDGLTAILAKYCSSINMVLTHGAMYRVKNAGKAFKKIKMDHAHFVRTANWFLIPVYRQECINGSFKTQLPANGMSAAIRQSTGRAKGRVLDCLFATT